MPHIILLGDSIFDNGRYTDGKPDVIAQVKDSLADKGKASLLAVPPVDDQALPTKAYDKTEATNAPFQRAVAAVLAVNSLADGI